LNKRGGNKDLLSFYDKEKKMAELQTKNEIKKSKNPNYQRDKDKELVKGIFHFYEVPGGILEFSYKKYKGDAVEQWTFKDGEMRQIPLGIAKHLNSSGKYPEYEHSTGPDGKQVGTTRIGRMVSRYGFESLEFLPIEDIGDAEPVSSIYTVENI
jgi:hypothetical protein